MFRYLPPQASTFGEKVDFINYVITDISVFFTVAIVGAMLYFAIKYRQRGGVDHETPQILGSHALEVIWTVVPTIVCIFVSIYGYKVYKEMATAPPKALEVMVTGKQWSWSFEYPKGKKTMNEIVVPVDEPVKFVMTSKDVLHSFFIPDMRVKKDLIPGMYTSLWFQPVKTGEYQVYCAEYCGKLHSGMLSKLKVVSRAEYDRWINDNSEAEMMKKMTPSKRGAQLFQSQGCNSCHTVDGSIKVGPSFKGLFGKTETMCDETTSTVDENYIKESILDPQKRVVKGFGPTSPMQSFQGVLSDEQVSDLIAFVKNVDEEAASLMPTTPAIPAVDKSKLTPAELGKVLYQEKACVGCHTTDGNKLVGPTFKGLFGREEKIQGGTTVKVDAEYIKKSIVDPNAQIVEGFAPAMPTFYGTQLKEDEINAIIEFIKTL